MSKRFKVPLFVWTATAILALSGCGDSTPEPAAKTASTAPDTGNTSAVALTKATASKTPAQGAFTLISADALKKAARISDDCNLDAVGGQAPGGAALDHKANPMFAGWVADTATGTVPRTARLVLKGAQDFALTFHTGSPARPDVAAALKRPALVSAGFEVYGDLSSVAPGDYSVVLLSAVAGQSLLCNLKKSLTVQ